MALKGGIWAGPGEPGSFSFSQSGRTVKREARLPRVVSWEQAAGN